MKSSLLLCCLLCAKLIACASIFKVQEDIGRQRRSDDVAPLQLVVNQLVNRVTKVEAEVTGLSSHVSPLQAAVSQLVARVTRVEAENTALQTELNSVKTKRCETGTQHLQPHDKPGKRHTVHINFAHPYNNVPWVAVSLRGIDEDNHTKIRVGSGFSGISTTGFNAFVYEWADSHIFGVILTWIACDM
ncbi:uncharacterized protein [Littorina saxatilis]|uniref:H-type lectin domain-containing protein n=1 Tax=Littorina saxatilis TaxID=31220 RepID=A0AAN9BLG2_9CAEN